MENYYLYWGKAKPKEGDTEPYHLLPYHCLDVAAVAAVLWERMPGRRRLLMDGLNLPEDKARGLVLWLIALHDLGKFSPYFQDMAWEARDALAPGKRQTRTYIHHDVMGFLLFDYFLDDQEGELTELLFLKEHMTCALKQLAGAVTGHHGRPPKLSSVEDLEVDDAFPPKDLHAAFAFIHDCGDLFELDVSSWQANEFAAQALASVSLTLSGFTILADWLGSNQNYFSYHTDPKTSLGDYFHNSSLPIARKAVHKTKLCPPRVWRNTGMQALFPTYKPTDLQQKVSEIYLTEQPQLFVIEDLTGSGKTEAALVLGHRLMVDTGAEGLFFGLPTSATSDQMFDRLAQAYDHLYDPNEGKATLILAHAYRRLSQKFTASIQMETPPEELEWKDMHGEWPASSMASAWLADHTKKCMLAAVGVGTVDQAMLAAVKSKHFTLRLWGLANKVLIIDEVHAYDAYMRAILEHLVATHARLGGSTILLSATLPRSMRQQLVNGYRRGLGLGPIAEPEHEEVYPLLTHVAADGAEAIPLEVPQHTRRKIHVEIVHEPPLEPIRALAEKGRCVCWIRNTVDDCLEAYRQLKAVITPEKLTCFHARFVLGDRLDIQDRLLHWFGKQGSPEDRSGRVVVATQVLEQSLDVDFDAMFSDLAPIDLLLQRLGRQMRHPRSQNGILLPREAMDERGKIVFTVYAPSFTEQPDSEWYARTFPRAHHIYEGTHLLWLTQKILHEKTTIELPGDARRLIESVYGPDPSCLPKPLQESFNKYQGGAFAAKSKAQQILSNLEQGYVYDSDFLEDKDLEIRTRLGLEQRTLRLLHWDSQEIKPLSARHQPDPWHLSQVSVAHYWLDKAVTDPAWDQALTKLSDTLPDKNRGVTPMPMVLDDHEKWRTRCQKDKNTFFLHYSREEGLTKDERK